MCLHWLVQTWQIGCVLPCQLMLFGLTPHCKRLATNHGAQVLVQGTPLSMRLEDACVCGWCFPISMHAKLFAAQGLVGSKMHELHFLSVVVLLQKEHSDHERACLGLYL